MRGIKNKAKEIIGKTIQRFTQLKKQQRILILLFIAVILFNFYYNAIYKWQSGALRRVKSEWQNLNKRMIKIKSQLPDIEREKESLKTSQKRLNSLKNQLSSLELQLPTYSRIPQLLGELVNQAQGYSIDFISIRPKMMRAKREYAQLTIEMKFNAPYSGFVNYLNRLESISQFLRATEITLEQLKGGFSGASEVTLTLTTLLGEEYETIPEERLKAPQQVSPLQIERSPFFSKFRPDQPEAKKEEFCLSGIIATGLQPTVIINDEVYRIGDMIGNKKIKQILPNMVILSDGKESIVLTLD